ncbi:hypothetical protein BHE74_00022544 [Ensete ventricosum]|uniref:Uncharacterized protein n=1 Tax=Ensete ventricosum TaxID=4639 RepID=A0A444C7L2_ENSVE|nr:hypothetical protein GW17_00056695 [Ensete ventricosum]RWW69822.1 hypothetical protein BHE74_00022544 [Ensete ventricosum]RZR70457.1 hypothetical protein BHM03_00000063 [Ensete ventricosum]
MVGTIQTVVVACSPSQTGGVEGAVPANRIWRAEEAADDDASHSPVAFPRTIFKAVVVSVAVDLRRRRMHPPRAASTAPAPLASCSSYSSVTTCSLSLSPRLRCLQIVFLASATVIFLVCVGSWLFLGGAHLVRGGAALLVIRGWNMSTATLQCYSMNCSRSHVGMTTLD